MNISILGIPMDLGAGRRGVDMGASALRNAQLAQALYNLGHNVEDLGDITVQIPETLDASEKPGLAMRDPIWDACQKAYDRLISLPEDRFPICIGGDHSISMGTAAGCARGKRTGIIWVDAHTDFNTPQSTESGNFHGMPVAHLVGLGDTKLSGIGQGWHVLPRDIVMIGIRSVDRKERDLLIEHNIKIFTMKEVDSKGIAYVAEEAVEYLSELSQIHVSFDADALDPSIAPGVGTPVPGGLSYREAHLLMEILAESQKISSLDIVEVNPILDLRNQTARIMVGMAESLLGKRIM
ncbi:MAG: arginase [Deinococcaceae bacterium]